MRQFSVVAQDREQWREVVQNVTQNYCESRIKTTELLKVTLLP
jgi:hypothetical protein